VKPIELLRSDAERIWTAALRAVEPASAVRKHVRRDGAVLLAGERNFDLDCAGNVWVLGAGKAAAAMGEAFERILGPYLTGGILVTRYEHGAALRKLEVLEAGHPLPDVNSVLAADRIEDFIQKRIAPGDLVFCLFSGGASSVLASPAPGITLEDKLRSTRILLRAGASIHELNAVRKHLSRLKGGGLARLLKDVTVVSVVLSDVVDDDPAVIASGPTAPDASTFADCLDILQKYDEAHQIPETVTRRFREGSAGHIGETPKDGDPAFPGNEYFIVGNNARACTAALYAARRSGYHAMVLASRLEGDTGAAAGFHMQILEEIAMRGRPLKSPACIISGGETTVKVTGTGRGGRNQEFVLHCVRRLARIPAPCIAVSLGTDGTDGPTDAAGAVADNSSLSRSLKFGSPFLSECIKNNNSYEYFRRLGDLIFTGPTRTNVMDLHILLIG